MRVRNPVVASATAAVVGAALLLPPAGVAAAVAGTKEFAEPGVYSVVLPAKAEVTVYLLGAGGGGGSGGGGGGGGGGEARTSLRSGIAGAGGGSGTSGVGGSAGNYFQCTFHTKHKVRLAVTVGAGGIARLGGSGGAGGAGTGGPFGVDGDSGHDGGMANAPTKKANGGASSARITAHSIGGSLPLHLFEAVAYGGAVGNDGLPGGGGQGGGKNGNTIGTGAAGGSPAYNELAKKPGLCRSLSIEQFSMFKPFAFVSEIGERGGRGVDGDPNDGQHGGVPRGGLYGHGGDRTTPSGVTIPRQAGNGGQSGAYGRGGDGGDGGIRGNAGTPNTSGKDGKDGAAGGSGWAGSPGFARVTWK